MLGLAAKPNPKQFQKVVIALGYATQQDPIVLSKPKTLQKRFTDLGFG